MGGETWQYWRNAHYAMAPAGYGKNCLSEPTRKHGEHGPTVWAGRHAHNAGVRVGSV